MGVVFLEKQEANAASANDNDGDDHHSFLITLHQTVGPPAQGERSLSNPIQVRHQRRTGARSNVDLASFNPVLHCSIALTPFNSPCIIPLVIALLDSPYSIQYSKLHSAVPTSFD